MSRPDGPARQATITHVSAGALHVPFGDVHAMADTFDLAGDRALSRAGHAGAAALSPGLLATAPFSPTTAAAAGAALAAAGAALTAWSAEIRLDAEAVRRAVGLLSLGDAEVRVALRTLEVELAIAYGRERVPPEVRRTDLQVPLSGTAPTGLTSVVDHLREVSRLSDDPARSGTIEIQTVTGADRARRHIVYLPGMDDLDPLSSDRDVRDAGAAVHLQAGLPTAYGAGVLEALHQTGAGPGEQILLVGHSQGGMQAVQLAMDESPYDITQVVTLGSPTIPGDVPSGVGVLALEHWGDPVPTLDGGTVPSPQVVSVTFDSGVDWPSPFANHELDHYVSGAAAVDHSTDPVVEQAVAGLDPFLAHPGDRVESTVFQIRRRRHWSPQELLP